MKNKTTVLFCTTVLVVCCSISYFILFPNINNLNSAATNDIYDLRKLTSRQNQLINRLEKIESSLSDSSNHLNELDVKVSDIQTNIYDLKTQLCHYYVEKLSDKTYIRTYNNDYTFYIAAEALGELGKPAIPILMSTLKYSNDSYETALIFYSLLLASQSPDVSVFTNGNYIHTYLDFDPATHCKKKRVAEKWWSTYKNNF